MSSGAIQIRGLVKTYGAFTTVGGIDLDVAPGSLVSLLGPSGCGKTTTLRMIAGFINPNAGRISVDGDVLSEAGSSTPPERRNMGMVFQSYAVWPHMTVSENIAYGLRTRRAPAAEIKRKVDEIVELVGLSGHEHKYPNALSGGQQQRVALARAVVTRPRILLLDEPLSNLDTKLREVMRFELRRIQQSLGITTVFVTHSQEEALVMSDQVAVMRDGLIVEQGTPHELYERPRSRFVADFMGLANFISGEVADESGDRIRLRTPFGLVEGAGSGAGGAPQIMVRPQHIELLPASPEPSTLNDFPATVTEAAFNGSIIDYTLDAGGPVPLRVQAFTPQRFNLGDAVRVRFDAATARVVTDNPGA